MRQHLLAAERARADALVARDLGALGALLHESLVYVHATGVRHGRGEFLAFVHGGPRFLAVDLQVSTIEVHDRFAWLSGELRMQLQRPAATEPVILHSWASAVWRRGAEGWQLCLFQSTKQAEHHG